MRLIDFAIASRGARAMALSLSIDENVPWGTHLAMRLVIARRPRSLNMVSLVAPCDVNVDAIKKRRKDNLPLPLWEEAAVEGAGLWGPSSEQCPFLPLVEQAPFTAANMEASEMLGERIKAWSVASECWLTRAGAVDPADAPQYRPKGFVRGHLPIVSTQPVVPAKRLDECFTAEPLLSSLSGLEHRLKDLISTRTRDIRNQIRPSIRRCLAALDLVVDATPVSGRDEAHREYVASVRNAPLASADALNQVLAATIGLKAKELTAANGRTTAAVHSWAVKSLLNGAGPAHRWIKQADLVDEKDPLPASPMLEAQLRQDEWVNFWVRQRTDRSHELALFDALRAKARRFQHELDPLSGHCLVAANKQFKPDRGRGFDQWAPREVGCLPLEALHELADIFNVMEGLQVALRPWSFC